MNVNMSGSSGAHLATWITEIWIFRVLKMKHKIFITNVTVTELFRLPDYM